MLDPRRVFLVLCAAAVGLGLLGCSSSSSTRSGADEDTLNTGYYTEKKSTSTNASTSITPSEEDKNFANDLSDLLQGQVSGVQVSQTNGNVRVLIRGPNSFYASNTPLYVVDGMSVSPGPNGTVPVNPRNVKSITVLKDAGATAIYGSRGANGVIVIETEH